MQEDGVHESVPAIPFHHLQSPVPPSPSRVDCVLCTAGHGASSCDQYSRMVMVVVVVVVMVMVEVEVRVVVVVRVVVRVRMMVVVVGGGGGGWWCLWW